VPKENKDTQHSRDRKVYNSTMTVKESKKKDDPLSLPWFSLVIMYHELSDTADKGTIHKISITPRPQCSQLKNYIIKRKPHHLLPAHPSTNPETRHKST
jgi:hypothetical protein